jgi:hypothetical protein
MRVETAHDNAERSKPSLRIFGKRYGKRVACGCGDNLGAVCLDGATSFVNADETANGRAYTDCSFVLQVVCWSNAPLKESCMDTTTLLIIIIILLVLGGGWYGRGRWY